MAPKRKAKGRHKTTQSEQPKRSRQDTVHGREVQGNTGESAHEIHHTSEQMGQASSVAAEVVPGSSSDGSAVKMAPKRKAKVKHKTTQSEQPKRSRQDTVHGREVQGNTGESAHEIHHTSEQMGQASSVAAEVVPGSSSDGSAETMRQLCLKVMNASIGYIKTIDEYNEDDDEDSRRTKFAGLGTVVFDKYLITAYHVLRKRIEKIYDIIILYLSKSKKEDELRQILVETNADIPFSKLVERFIKKRREEECNSVDRILKPMSKFVNIGELNLQLSSEMNEEKCVVEFSCGEFIIDWKILYGDEKTDLAMVQLKTTRQKSYPDCIFLDDKDNSPKQLTMKVVREIATNRITLDLEFQPLTPSEREEKRKESQWKDSPICDQHLVIFRTKEWFQRGTSGSSMIHIKQDEASIHAIFQRMHPEKHFEEHGYERYRMDWEQLLGSGRKTFDLTEILRNNELLPAAPAQIMGSSPLCTACRDGNKEFVTMLLDDGAGVNVCDRKGCTPLENAIAGNHFDVVVMLIGKNADVNKCGTAVSASTPLCTACRDGRLDIVRRLLGAGADITISDGNGRSPLQLARDSNHEEIIRLLE